MKNKDTNYKKTYSRTWKVRGYYKNFNAHNIFILILYNVVEKIAQVYWNGGR